MRWSFPQEFTIALNGHEDLIDSRIEVHDSQQFEVKLDYSIDPIDRKNRYRVEAYLFIPESLGVNSLTYSREQFYADVQAYIRFKTPDVSLVALLDPHDPRSPLARLQGFHRELMRDPRSVDAQHKVKHELKLLGCVLRANLRDRTASIREVASMVDGRAEQRSTLVDDLRNAVVAFVRETRAVLSRYRDLRTSFLEPAVPQRVQDTYERVDEYLSLILETYLTRVVEGIDRSSGLRGHVEAARSELVTSLLAEREYRRGAGYVALAAQGATNEHYVYRLGFLKKLVMSVLFLNITKLPEGRRLSHFLAALAAGLAMFFSTATAIWSTQTFGLNTFPAVAALVVGYMFKDRIKEGLRDYFSGKLARWIYDYNVSIRDPRSDKVVGQCRESMSFMPRTEVPPEVLARRRSDARSTLEEDAKAEVVLRYVKSVSIRADVIGHEHGRLGDINDIIRISVANFLTRMDDPVRPVRVYVGEHDHVDELPCPKSYHINIVFVLRALDGKKPAAVDRIRVILDRNGIRRLEEVGA